jgi:LacI family transcriptional regulator
VPKWTISDIAREAQVSKTTVSRVLNGRPDVDRETSTRILALVKDIGYVPSARAVQLAKGKANAIGLLAPVDTSPWMVEVLRGAMESVQSTSFSLVLHAFPRSPADEIRLANQLRSGAMDALMVVSLQASLPVLVAVAAEGLPIMMLNDHGHNDGLPAIVPDENIGISAAVAHLVDCGRKRFACLAGEVGNPVTRPRLESYRMALAARGLTLDERLVVSADFALMAAQAATDSLLDRGVPFDALFASSDAMAVGAMRALKRRGLQTPRDVSVVGFDDFSSAEYAEPRLTTVHNPLHEMSMRAAGRLLEAVRRNEPLPRTEEWVHAYLAIRDSSDPRRA